MELRKVANRDEAVRLLSEAAASGLERAVWARQNGINVADQPTREANTTGRWLARFTATAPTPVNDPGQPAAL